MEDTQANQVGTEKPSNLLQSKIDSFVQMHKQLVEQEQNLSQQLEITRMNKLKVEGAYEALMDFKSFSVASNQAEVDARYEKITEDAEEAKSEAEETIN